MIDVIRELQSYGCNVIARPGGRTDRGPAPNTASALPPGNDLPRASAIAAAVAHTEYADLGVGQLCEKPVPNGVPTDVKSRYDPAALEAAGAKVWRLGRQPA